MKLTVAPSFSLLLAVGALSLASCDQELPGDEICRDIGYAIANKSFECDGDADLANKRYEDFTSRYTCKIKDIPGEDQLLDDRISEPPRDSVGDPYKCSAAILQFTCDKVAQIGEDYDQWLSASSFCGAAYDPIGTSSGGGSGGSGQGGDAGQGGSAGEAGSGGVTEVNLTVEGSINGQNFLAQCQLSPNVNLSFSCMDSSSTGFFFTIKTLTSGHSGDFSSFDALYRVEPLQNNQFQPMPAASDSISQIFCNTDVTEGPDPNKQVSLTLDALISRQGPVPFSMTLKGFASNVPCEASCP